MADATKTMGLREFARSQGFNPSWATALKQAGRLVMTDDGRRVKVAESIARIEATRDPSKAGVAARHAAARAQAAEPADTEAAPAAGPEDRAGSLYQRAKAENEKYKALKARLEYEQMAGKLVPVDQAVAVAADIAATCRSRLENLPSLISGHVHEDDRGRIFTTVSDIVEALLHDMADTFRKRMPGENQ